jgi:methyl-accepting chemotaxis protein
MATGGQQHIDGTAESNRGFRKRPGRVREVAKLIGEIADPMNLLSLNASIKAVHAGESKSGIAVVAEEISKLADSPENSVR